MINKKDFRFNVFIWITCIGLILIAHCFMWYHLKKYISLWLLRDIAWSIVIIIIAFIFVLFKKFFIHVFQYFKKFINSFWK